MSLTCGLAGWRSRPAGQHGPVGSGRLAVLPPPPQSGLADVAALLLVASKRTLAGKKVMYLASSRVGSLHKKRVRVVNQASMLLPNST